jgi:hypothetical protein
MIRERNRELGVLTILTGLFLLVILRLWMSPIARGITGRGEIAPLEFLLIPVFFIIVGIGILLFLWEPESE